MLKFKDYKYERPDMKKLEGEFLELLKKFDDADSFEAQDEAMKEINDLRNEFDTMADLVYIRHTIDTTDEFYEKENNFIDEVRPIYEGLISKYC